MKTVLVAGATGYLGRHIVNQYMSMGWHVRALVRDAASASTSGLVASELFEGEATKLKTLSDVMEGVDLVVSALGITRQRDGLSYWDVDYQANSNLLAEAVNAKVARFAYVHVLHAERMLGVPLAAAKQAFADELRTAPIASTIIAPSGFFSDMGEFLSMARSGRIWVFGTGSRTLNPIDGADLAQVIAEAIWEERSYVPVGGPDVLSQFEVGEEAFHALGKKPRITRVPDVIRRFALKIMPHVTPAHVHGPALFFLTALGMDMVGDSHGTKTIQQHFRELAANDPDKRTTRNGALLRERTIS